MSARAVVQTQALAKPKITPVVSGLLQRVCACGKHSTGSSGECEGCRKKREGMLHRSVVLQTKPTINKPGDQYEQEADRVAALVMATSLEQSVNNAPPRIQRIATQPTGETVPASVNQVLAGPGAALEPSLRQDMEQRFGRNFSQVRVHSDTAAKQSAQNLDSYAYTVGQNIVFGANRFSPGTEEGRCLLAHELTHIVQQSDGATAIQRFVPCTRARLSLEECPNRDPHEESISRHDPSIVAYITSPEIGYLITNFNIGDSKLKTSAKLEPHWSSMIRMIAQTGTEWKIWGLSDCHGTERLNTTLREKRAASIRAALPAAAATHIVETSGASLEDCITDNENMIAREWNRSVLITPTKRQQDFPPETIDVKSPLEKPDTEDCDKNQLDALARAFPTAKKMVRASLSVLDDDNLMKKYFGKDAHAHRFHIKKNFVEILNGLDIGPTFECEKADSWWCDGAVARVLPILGENIHICPSAIARGNDYLARTIVHEAAHRYAWIFIPDELCAGGWPSSGDTTDAEDNADCYGEFAGDALAQSP
jgi:hypothetical protein